MSLATPSWPEHRDNETVCAFVIGEGGARRTCGRVVRAGSAYCPDHHALCHIKGGTSEEISRLLEVELLANAVGGRRGGGGEPTRRFLRRVENAVRTFSRPQCS